MVPLAPPNDYDTIVDLVCVRGAFLNHSAFYWNRFCQSDRVIPSGASSELCRSRLLWRLVVRLGDASLRLPSSFGPTYHDKALPLGLQLVPSSRSRAFFHLSLGFFAPFVDVDGVSSLLTSSPEPSTSSPLAGRADLPPFLPLVDLLRASHTWQTESIPTQPLPLGSK